MEVIDKPLTLIFIIEKKLFFALKPSLKSAKTIKSAVFMSFFLMALKPNTIVFFVLELEKKKRQIL